MTPNASSSRTRLAAVAVAMAALVLAFAVATAPSQDPRFHGTTYTEVAPAADFSLVDHDGRVVTLASYRGRPVLLFFGFTHCPDVCPLTLDRLGRAVEQAGRAARDAQILLVTVDPARDTPEVLREYTARFAGDIVGLTGDSASLEHARRGYGAYTVLAPAAPAWGDAGHAGHGDHGAHGDPAAEGDEASPRGERTIHSSVVYGIDRRGDLQVVISETATPEQMAADVRTLSRL